MRTPLNKATLGLAAAALLAIAACVKTSPRDEEEQEQAEEEEEVVIVPPKEVTKENIVGAYYITKVETSASGQRSDITKSWFKDYAGECAKDDLTTFKPDSSFIVQDGSYTCDESTDDTGTWKFINKSRMLIDSDTAVIEELTSTSLRIVSPVYSSPQGNVIFTYTRK